MLNLEKKNDEKVNSPKKTFDIFKIFPKGKHFPLPTQETTNIIINYGYY